MGTVGRTLSTLGLIGLVTGAVTSAAAAPATRVALLELYTSEGCNSCPPADQWVSALPRPQLVPGRLVVLAFHVDYWNDLGWPDRFSQARFSDRQRQQVRANGLRTAYTPQLLLNGRDYRVHGDINAEVSRINAEPAAVRMELSLARRAGAVSVDLRAEPQRPRRQPLSLYLAVYENHLESDVAAGENRGRKLRHDYVVRTLLGPTPVTAGAQTRWRPAVPLAPEWKTADLGVAAFVQDDTTGEVLQALAAPVD